MLESIVTCRLKASVTVEIGSGKLKRLSTS
jgi:hypothetical protein